jgi:hypothetical protein
MKTRMTLFIAAMFGGMLLPFFFVENEKDAMYFVVPWIVLLLAAQFIAFRRPHCGKLATFPPTGGAAATPNVGSVCRHCHKDY